MFTNRLTAAGVALVLATGLASSAGAARPSPGQATSDPSPTLHAPAEVGHGTAASEHANGTDGHGKAPSAAEPEKSMSQWESQIASNGNFAIPELTVAQRPAFGIAAGEAQLHHAASREHASAWVVTIMWGALILAIAVTVFLAYRLSRTTDTRGNRARALTLGTKLLLSFGALASMILLVSALAVSSGQRGVEATSQLVRAEQQAATVNALQSKLLEARLAVLYYLRNKSDKALTDYSNAMASAAALAEQAAGQFDSTENIQLAEKVHEELLRYDQIFSEVVATTDRMDGVVNAQLRVAGIRVIELLQAVMDSAHDRGQIIIALEAAEAAEHMGLARVALLTFLKSDDHAQAEEATAQLQAGHERLDQLAKDVQDPVHEKWVAEAMQAFEFYEQQIETVIHLRDQVELAISEQLAPIGTEIAEDGHTFVEAINQTQQTIVGDITAASATSRALVLGVSVVAVVMAVMVSVVLIRSILSAINRVLPVLRGVASGDLTHDQINLKSSDELGEIARATDQMSQSLTTLINQVNGAVREVTSAATEIAASSEEMAQGMAQQTEQATQVSAAVEQMSATVVEVAKKSADAADSSNQAGQQAGEGGQVVQKTVDAMNQISQVVNDSANAIGELGKLGEQIGQIISVINDIADQTNLLALNAAIEAARAGEHGRGFAVVADEVRKLAERTTQATEEVAQSIRAIQDGTSGAVERMQTGTDRVDEGVQLATQAGDSLGQIVTGARSVAEMIQSIAAAAEQQSASAEQISRNVENITAVTRQSSEGAQQAAAAAAQLSGKAEELQSVVDQFKLS